MKEPKMSLQNLTENRSISYILWEHLHEGTFSLEIENNVIMDFDGPLQANSFANAFNNNPLLLLRIVGSVQAPMEERRALARDWLKRRTSASCSASTMTRASCSVPE